MTVYIDSVCSWSETARLRVNGGVCTRVRVACQTCMQREQQQAGSHRLRHRSQVRGDAAPSSRLQPTSTQRRTCTALATTTNKYYSVSTETKPTSF